MTIYHIVLFKFKPLVPPEEVKAACNRMLALETNCVHPTTQKPYVKALGGGIDNSPEGTQDLLNPRLMMGNTQQNGMTYAFIHQFDNEDDRKYYLEKDPAHQEFVASIQDILEKAQVVDFTPNVF
ncbi:hypothetical protein AAE478_010308 [Parahypoxylon ruwenzoriense]